MLVYAGLEPVTVSGATTITINAPNSATVVLADSGTTSDKIFSVDFNAGGETHSITAADTVAGITLNLGSGTNNVTLNALDPAFKGTRHDQWRARRRHRYREREDGVRHLYLQRRRRHRHAGRPELPRSSGRSPARTRAVPMGRRSSIDVENLTGGSGADEFTIVADGSISGQINGGAGSDTLIGPDAVNVWTLSGANAGKVGTTDFVGIENLTGGNANDTFKLQAAGSVGGVIDGGAASTTPSVDSLDYSSRGSPVSVNLELSNGTAVSGFSHLTTIVGSGAATDTLIGPVALQDQTAWTITGANAGTVDGTAFSAFANLTGQGSTNDAFIFAAGGSLSGTIDGGAGGARRLRGRQRRKPDRLPAVRHAAPARRPWAARPSTTTGMDAYDPRGGPRRTGSIIGTIFDRDLVLEADTAGNMKVSFTGLTFTSGGSSFSFANPSDS